MHLVGWHSKDYRIVSKSRFFDRAYYLREYPDVVSGHFNPVIHYIQFGWREGRNPSADFNTLEYLQEHPDCKICPLIFEENTRRKCVDLSVCAIMKNEAPYVREWIDYHRLLGVKRFYIYDNESTDNLKDVLSWYIKSGIVVYKYFPGAAQQLPAYNECLQNYRNETRWMAFIDADEFIVPVKKKTITSFLKDYEKYPGVGINWICFDSNGHETKPDGGVLENYTRVHRDDGDPGNHHIKSIVQTAFVKEMINPHFATYYGDRMAVTENKEEIIEKPNNQLARAFTDVVSVNKIRINHYFSKSMEEYKAKLERGRAPIKDVKRTFIQNQVIFPDHKYDYTIFRFFPQLHKKPNILLKQIFSFLFNKRKKRDKRYMLLVKSDLFDAEWYQKQNPDVTMDPIEHYLDFGWKEGRNPSSRFDNEEYYELNPDVRGSGFPPLLHYEQYGKKEGRRYKTSVRLKESENVNNYAKTKDGFLDVNLIKKIIDNPDIKIVSFDIFDTLLIRPAIKPTDILYLVDAKLKHENNIDFIEYRLSAEIDMQNPYASFDDIYAFIQEKYKLDDDTIDIMKKAELNVESQLLTRRDDLYELYQYAVEKGKKIIAVSDMYLSAEFLKNVLHKNGYVEIQNVYVSNEMRARKDDGTLYEKVIENENSSAILHIGDNMVSDCKNAIEKNIMAVHYPSIHDIIFKQNSIWDNIWPTPDLSEDPMCRILLGFTFNHYFKNMNQIANQKSIFADFESFVGLAIAPMLFYIANSIANNHDVQQNYSQVLFAGRDGYMPKFCYDILAKYYEKLLPSKYVYAGRRAYFSTINKSFTKYMQTVDMIENLPFTIKNILDGYIVDENIKSTILSQITESEKLLDYTKDKDKILSVLGRFDNVLNQYMENHAKESKRYYDSVISGAGREIIFDCGYSGSVSVAIGNIVHKPIDKIYLWETPKNQDIDQQNNTKTILLMNEDKAFASEHLIYEELFSPLDGGCLGFQNGEPILEKLLYSDAMKHRYDELQNVVSNYMVNICDMFKDYLPYLNVKDTANLRAHTVYAITRSPFNEISLLDDIKHPDTAFLAQNQSLAYKVQKYLNYDNPFAMTGFENPDKLAIVPSVLLENEYKIGVHIHLYYVPLYGEFLYYLKDFPQKFDLIITVCDKDKIDLLKNLFNNKTCPNLNQLFVKVVENRGRDIAPWLVACKDIQSNYDLFCHVHSKYSPHIEWGDDWRRYLLKNLLDKDSVTDMINMFHVNKKLGCLYPGFYGMLRKTYIIANGHLLGEDGEEALIQNLIDKLNFNYNISRRSLHYSGGTMMWYRTEAMRPLFDLNLKFEDFPPEPISVGGTIAHAIERIPALVCWLNGYEEREYTKYKN